MVPGCVCGSGGSVVSQQIPEEATKRADYIGWPSWTHAVHIRLASPKKAASFCSNPAVSAVLQRATEACEQLDVLLWNSEVENEMESVFRQGDGWGAGVELVLFLAGNDRYAGNSADDMAPMLKQLGEVAESSRAGSLQCVSGMLEPQTTVAAPSILMARFHNPEQLDAFTGCPPYQAVWEGNAMLPGQSLVSVTFNIAPSEKQNMTGF
mmetsp:Transcript_9709/g.27765  ORF Transcript_9709/g.27765 Transcript_9709/m.27765 type:complete len:209 (-) Transcript_9709:54-680(-)